MLFFGALCLLALSGYVGAECAGGCNEPTVLYKDLGCKPKFASTGDCCPSEFDCSHIGSKAAANEEKCYFNGKAYNIGEAISDSEVDGDCKVGCTCSRQNSGKMGFTCDILHCPGRSAALGCHLTYALDKCCSIGVACPPFNARCEVYGKTYYEGQTFANLYQKCSKCVCGIFWAGNFEAPFCKKTGCVEEVNQQKEVYGFCAPSYFTKDECCHYNWICPEHDDIIVSKPAPSNADLKCKFGDKTLNVGDKFEKTHGERGKIACECRIPPYVTCIQNYE